LGERVWKHLSRIAPGERPGLISTRAWVSDTTVSAIDSPQIENHSSRRSYQSVLCSHLL